MPESPAVAADKVHVRLVDKALLILWVWSYAALLYAFGLVKRFEKLSASQ
jgi:hypothetical protein